MMPRTLLPLLLTVLVARGSAQGACSCSLENCPPAENCTYGVTKDLCDCCDTCFKGPGEECGGYSGKCTNGTTCIVSVEFGTLVNVYYSTKGTCVPDQPPPPVTCTPTPSYKTSSTSIAESFESSSFFLSPSSFSSLPGPTPTPTLAERRFPECRTLCSVDFCWDGLNRYCAANETAYGWVEERGECQHTTCKACKLLVAPDCPECPVPVNKRCLRHYWMCINEHYQRDDILLDLSDTRARSAHGKVICHVPNIEVLEDSAEE